MTDEKMINGFKAALKENGQTLKFFYDKYLPDIKVQYSAVSKQLSDYTALSDEVRQAAEKYLHDTGR